MRRALRRFWGGIEEISKIAIESLVEGLRATPRQPDKSSIGSLNCSSRPKCIEVVLRVHGLAA